jgi:hypothetical protein
MNARDLVSAYDEMVDRAFRISGAYSREEMARLSFVGEMAVISWPEAHSGYYDSCSIETQTTQFPAALLDAPEAEVEFWISEQKRLKEEASKRWYAERAAQQKAQELQTLAALKAKYGA